MSLGLYLYKVYSYGDEEELFSGNITHNLNEMAEHISAGDKYNLYQLLWRPEEHGFERVSQEYIDAVCKAYLYMSEHRSDLEQYNPSNGWGSYTTLLDFVSSYINDLKQISEEEMSSIYIFASR